jgi:hypothetical protein
MKINTFTSNQLNSGFRPKISARSWNGKTTEEKDKSISEKSTSVFLKSGGYAIGWVDKARIMSKEETIEKLKNNG